MRAKPALALTGSLLALSIVAILLALRPAHSVSAAEAAPCGFRGDGNGRYPAANVPAEWDEKKNVRWKTEVGESYSSPIVSGGKIFLTSEPNLLICVSAADGKVLWKKTMGFEDLPEAERPKELPDLRQGGGNDAGNTASTPCADGKHVFVCFDCGLVASFDYDGNRAWLKHHERDTMTGYGRSSSVLLAGGKLLVTLACLTALDPATGVLQWEAKGASGDYYGTPAIGKAGETLIAITPHGEAVRVSDGKVLAKGLSSMTNVSPILVDSIAYFVDSTATAYKLSFLTPDQVKAEELWSATLEGEFYASPLLHDGLLHTVNKEALYWVLDAKTGKAELDKQALTLPPGGQAGEATVYPSPALLGKHLLLANDQGDALVLEPGKEYKEVKRNKLPNGAAGCLACNGAGFYVRGEKFLYAIGTP